MALHLQLGDLRYEITHGYKPYEGAWQQTTYQTKIQVC